MNNKDKNSQTQARKFTPTIQNKKARYEYHLLEKFEAGIALVGTEVKSLRQGNANLQEAFARLRGGELFLLGCHIGTYEHGNIMNHEPLRPRKLLVHRRELKKIEIKLNQKGLTLVPLRIYFTRGLAKVEIALAKGKSHADKRQKLIKEQVTRDAQREMRKYHR